MNNDLISRSALIKWIDDSVSQYGHTYSTDMLNMWGLFKDYLINKAPTVTPDMAQVLAYESGKASAERPTGEWLEWEDEKWGGVWHYCSNCHNDALYKRVDGIFKQILSDFCPNCGAKMIQESENE